MAGDKFYWSREWKALSESVKREWRAAGRPCGFCGKPLDWGKKYAVVVDHIRSKNSHPQLALERSNLQCICHGDNSRKRSWIDNSKKAKVGIDGFPEGWG